MPPTIRVSRSTLEDLARGLVQPCDLQREIYFPLIARPVDSHAGRGLVKLDAAQEIVPYIADNENSEFFVSPFVDYRSSDGLFRKYRIIWVDGQPYPCHMAISDDWKLWYYNAGMSTNAAKRDEEARFMTAFDDGFGRRHAAALSAIVEKFGLEYMGIDCAEMPDGRLLVFEGAVAMVAHNMDSPSLYPYKGPQMRKLFASFNDMLKRKALVRAVSA
jgi:glutathione synthase/RimK-type ligase-like ATP-grasp enzyme